LVLWHSRSGKAATEEKEFSEEAVDFLDWSMEQDVLLCDLVRSVALIIWHGRSGKAATEGKEFSEEAVDFPDWLMEQDAFLCDPCALCGFDPVAQSFRKSSHREETEFSEEAVDFIADELTERIVGAA
jgi:hypothetical protein